MGWTKVGRIGGMRAVPVSEVFRPLVEGVGVASVADAPVADYQYPALVGGGSCSSPGL